MLQFLISLGIGLLLIWLPIAGFLISGSVGGYKAGSPGKALGAAGLSILTISIGAATLTGVIADMPLLGAGLGLLTGGYLLLQSAPLVVGALIGGVAATLARKRGWRA